MFAHRMLSYTPAAASRHDFSGAWWGVKPALAVLAVVNVFFFAPQPTALPGAEEPAAASQAAAADGDLAPHTAYIVPAPQPGAEPQALRAEDFAPSY